MINWTVIITVSLAVAAIVSPIIVTCVNNRHNYKIRKLELATDKKIAAFENYTRSLANYLNNPTEHRLEILKSEESKSIIYVSSETLRLMYEISALIDGGKIDIVKNKYLPDLCCRLQKDLGIYKSGK